MISSHAADVEAHNARDPEIIVHALAWSRRRRDIIIRVIQSALHLTDDSMHDRSPPDNRIQVYNAHHERDIRYATQLFRWILKPIGIWHLIYTHSSRMEKSFSATMIFVCLAVLSFVLVPSSPYALFSKNDINTKAKLIGPMFFCLTAAIKYCILGMRSERIGRCVEQMENDWRIVRYQDHRRMMLDNALVGRRLTTLSVIFLYTGGMSYHIILPLSVSRSNLTNKPLIYQGYDVYFDSQASPAYDIVFSLHCMSAMIQYNITTAACSLAAIFVMHVCGQVQILMTMLGDLIEGKRDKGTTVEERLGMIARYHVRVLRFTTDVERLLREMCLLELVTATLIICLLEYYFMTEWENNDFIGVVTYFILFISLSFNFLIFCYIGELLVEEYSKIASAVYGINWYDLPGRKAVDLIMIITMSQCPPKFTAGKFVDLSLSTFSAVLRTSMVYFNLLRTVT